MTLELQGEPQACPAHLAHPWAGEVITSQDNRGSANVLALVLGTPGDGTEVIPAGDA